MPRTEYLRGHRIVKRDGVWVYADNGASTVANWQSRPCGVCSLPFTEDGHDGCLGEIPGVRNACCGHGITGDAYVQFDDGTRLDGTSAVEFFAGIKAGAH